MALNQTETVTTDDIVKADVEEISEDDLDIDLNLTHNTDWKLSPNVECRVTLQKLNIPPSGKNENHNLRDSEINVQRVHSSHTEVDTYSQFILLVDELSNFVDKCENKCSDCEEYILLLQNHVIQTHVRSRSVNRSHEGQNPSYWSNKSNHGSGIYKNCPSSLNKIPNNDDEEEVSRMSVTPSGNQNVGSVGSLINPELITLEHVNHFSTIKKEQDDNMYQDDPLLNIEVPSDLHLEHDQYFLGSVVASSDGQLRGETELTGTHSKNSVGNTASTFFTNIGTKLKPSGCTICGVLFTTNDFLIRHVVLKHKGGTRFSGVETFKCSICAKCFPTNKSLARHKVIHTTSEFRFNCDICGRCFTSSSHLITHQGTHTRERAFKCDLCEQSFNRNWNLTRHKLLLHYK